MSTSQAVESETWISMVKAAKILGISRNSVERHLVNKGIVCYRTIPGGSGIRQVLKEEIERYKASLVVRPASSSD